MSTIFIRSGTAIKRMVEDPKRFVALPIYVIDPIPTTLKLAESFLATLPDSKFFDNVVDVEEGPADFYISDKSPELSSLHNFSRDIYRAIPRRGDWYFNRKRIVEKIRLDKFISEQGIERLDYLRTTGCQGNDLNVLKSLGDKIDIVQAGTCKGDWLASIYNNENHALTIANFLIEKGFAVEVCRDRNQIQRTGMGVKEGLEATVHFKRKIV